jgi:preprotein translocase subunit SecD
VVALVVVGVAVGGVVSWRARHWKRAASITVEIDAEHPYEDGMTPADALARTLDVLRKRADKFDLRGVVEERRLSVEVPSGVERARVVALMTRPARIAFIAVDDGSKYMDQVASRFSTPRDGVDTGSDFWTERLSGTSHEDRYLRADHLATLQSAFAQVSKALPLPDNRVVVFGDGPREGDEKRTMWRSYLVEKYGFIDNQAVRAAEMGRDTVTGGLELKVELNVKGGWAMEALTQRCLGRKILIELEGRVSSAPVVESKIGRRMNISLDPVRDPTGEDAEVLAVLLPVGALAAPVRAVDP